LVFRGRSVSSVVPDPSNLKITKRNLGNINRQLPVSALDSVLPVGIGTRTPDLQSKFRDQEQDPAQNFLSPITRGIVKGNA
jgi:hypothetical protein